MIFGLSQALLYFSSFGHVKLRHWRISSTARCNMSRITSCEACGFSDLTTISILSGFLRQSQHVCTAPQSLHPDGRAVPITSILQRSHLVICTVLVVMISPLLKRYVSPRTLTFVRAKIISPRGPSQHPICPVAHSTDSPLWTLGAVEHPINYAHQFPPDSVTLHNRCVGPRGPGIDVQIVSWPLLTGLLSFATLCQFRVVLL